MRQELEIRVSWLERACMGKENRERKHSDSVLQGIARDIRNWETVVKFSRISMIYGSDEQKQIYVAFMHDAEHEPDFYDRNNEPIRMALRADDYWVVCRNIVEWYKTKQRKWGHR